MIAIVEAKIPKNVFTSASEIPVANSAGSGAPPAIAAKALIIPNTVPIKPINVDTEAEVERILQGEINENQ